MVGFIYITQIYKYYYHILPLKSTLLINYPTFEHLLTPKSSFEVNFPTRPLILKKSKYGSFHETPYRKELFAILGNSLYLGKYDAQSSWKTI
jgi:hypothetical protein